MVISETIFKNNELPLNSSLFIFKGRENLCMNTHYLYDEIQGEGDSKTTNYNKFIVPMMVPFELEREYYYTEYPFPEEGVTHDDVRKVWIDMTKFKKNKPFTDNDYIYPILIGDKSEIRPEYNSIYSLCRLSDEEIQEYIVNESELMYTFEYQKSFSDTTDKVVKYDFISKHCRERETYSFRLNSLKVIPEDEPYFEMFKTLQTQMTEKTKFYVEYYPTVSYPNNYVEGDESFDTVNPGRDNVIVYIPNIYSKEYVDGEMKITQNINVFAEEGKFIVFLNGTLVNYSVVKTDVPLTMSDGSKKYKRIQLENCSHLLRRREVNNELGNLSVRDDVVTIIYWDGVKYVKLNRDTAYSTAFYSPKLFIDRAKDEGGPVTMVIPTTFYYTAESNNKIKPRRLSDDNCLVVRDGKILRPEVDYKIRDERLLLNSFDEMGILDEELSKLVYDDEEGGIMYDFTRYRNQLSDLADSYINTEVLYFYDENNVEKVFIDRETRDILVNEPAIGSVLVKNWRPNDIFIGGTNRIDLEYQTTEPDGLDAIDESSPVYGQKRTRLSVPLTENVASSTEEWTMEEGESVVIDDLFDSIDFNLPDAYMDFNFLGINNSRNTIRKYVVKIFNNQISVLTLNEEVIENCDGKFTVLYVDGNINRSVTYNRLFLDTVNDDDGSKKVDVTEFGNRFDIIPMSDVKRIFLLATDDNKMSILMCLTKSSHICIVLTTAHMRKNGDDYIVSFIPIMNQKISGLNYTCRDIRIFGNKIYFLMIDSAPTIHVTKLLTLSEDNESAITTFLEDDNVDYKLDRYTLLTSINETSTNDTKLSVINDLDCRFLNELNQFIVFMFNMNVGGNLYESVSVGCGIVKLTMINKSTPSIEKFTTITGKDFFPYYSVAKEHMFIANVSRYDVFMCDGADFLLFITSSQIIDGTINDKTPNYQDVYVKINWSMSVNNCLFLPRSRIYDGEASEYSNSSGCTRTSKILDGQIADDLGEDLRYISGHQSGTSSETDHFSGLFKPYCRIISSSQGLRFTKKNGSFLFYNIVGNGVNRYVKVDPSIEEIYLSKRLMIDYLTDSNIDDNVDILLYGYITILPEEATITNNNYLKYSVDIDNRMKVLSERENCKSYTGYACSCFTATRKRLFSEDEVLSVFSGYPETVNFVEIYEDFSRFFDFDDRFASYDEERTLQMVSAYKSIVDNIKDDGQEIYIGYDTYLYIKGDKTYYVHDGVVSCLLSNFKTFYEKQPIDTQYLKRKSVYGSNSHVLVNMDIDYSTVPEFESNVFHALLSQINPTLIYRDDNLNYKLLLIDGEVVAKANSVNVPSFKKVCRNYDPFRNTNVYRLKVFSK